VAGDTDFSVENLRIKDLPPLDPEVAKPRRRQREFVQLSRKQLAVLRQGRARASAAVWNVFIELVWLSWKGGDKPFKFSRRAMGELGISHDSGVRAVHALGDLGLIGFSQPTVRSSLIITVHRL
jgi:hypothetical protein